MRYKTPANNFPVFVERNFLEKYDYDMRSSILKSAEKEKIIKSEEECSSDKGKIENLRKKIEDEYNDKYKIKMEIYRIERSSICKKISEFKERFNKYYGESG